MHVTTLGWTLYLAVMLFCTVVTIATFLCDYRGDYSNSKLSTKVFIHVWTAVNCLSWAIWYMYYLN